MAAAATNADTTWLLELTPDYSVRLPSYSNFAWHDAPMSSIYWPIAAVTLYLVTISAIPMIIPARISTTATKKQKQEKKNLGMLDYMVVQHNLNLCVWSLVMFLGTTYEVFRRYTAEGNNLEFFVCEHPETAETAGVGATGPLYFWSYIYYISKFYELFDTVLTLSKGSRLPHTFLHVFHHSVVVFMAWWWLELRQTLQWGGLIFNTFVHVVMYFYYALKVLQIPTPWKRWITTLQVVQFVSSMGFFAGTMYYMHGPGREGKGEGEGERCAGMTGLYLNLAFNVVLLKQFVGVLFGGGAKRGTTKPKAE